MSRPDWHTPKGERRRDQLLEAARTIIAKRGYAGATQRSIAAEAGVPPASTHYFFDSVDDLICHAAEQYLEERLAFYEAWIDEFAAGERSPAEGCRLAAEVLTGIPVAARTVQFEIYLNAPRHEELEVPVATAFERLEQLCVRLLATMDVPQPEQWSQALLAVSDGFALRAVAGAPVDAAALERAILAMVEVAERDRPAEVQTSS